MRFLLALVLGLAGLLIVAPAHAADMDCGDFATQAAAQSFFNAAGPGDPHRLDSDGDGIACESNPCPCSTTIAPVVGLPTTPPVETTAPVVVPTETIGTAPVVPIDVPDAAEVNADGPGDSGPVMRARGIVVKVADGDTISVRIGRRVQSIRILGIDTPEVYGKRECGGAEASAAMKRLAPIGARVTLISDPTQANKDRYRRLLRYVERGGRDLGKKQILLGHARTYVYRNDPFTRTATYQRAESRSQGAKRGAWARCWR